MLARDQRLARGEDVRAVLRRGRRRAGALVVVHVRSRGDDAPGRVTAVASKRVGGAVQRNRAKRVLRAAVAEVGVAPGVDVALVARPPAAASHRDAVVAELRGLYGGPVGQHRDRAEVS